MQVIYIHTSVVLWKRIWEYSKETGAGNFLENLCRVVLCKAFLL